LAIWLPTIRNDFVDWDDLNMIVHNPRFNPPTWAGVAWYWTHPAWNLYQPLTTTLWALLARLGWIEIPDQFGGHMNPADFHLAAIILQSGAAVVLFHILRLVLQSERAAVIGSLLFAIHPIQTEAVAFAGAMNNPLAGFLGLLAIWQYLKATSPTCPPQSRLRYQILGLTALVLAMLAKPNAVVIPPIAFMLEWATHRRPLRSSLCSILPWILLVLPCVIWTKMIQHGVDFSQSRIAYRPLIATDSVLFYMRKLLWPTRLGVDYGRTPLFVHEHGLGWVTLLAPLALLMAAVFFSRRSPLLAAAAGIFLVALLPNSGLVPFDSQLISTVSDRYAYLSLVGVAVAVGVAVRRYAGLRFVCVPILVALAMVTETQISVWKNGEALFRHALVVNPDSWMAETNLAFAISDHSPQEAAALCRSAISSHPANPSAWNTLGSVLMATGRHEPAIAAFRRAHELSPGDALFLSNYQKAAADKRN
jgi:hypothetical protein